ncbi:MAG TPA: 3D domain-containing protein [Gaiellaceae bacterium]|nr:3D domain-containing protein [Gaiellaceae bacterium]
MISLLASGGAHADDPASQADALRANNTGLAAKSHQVLLRLYSLQSRLAQSAQRLEALRKLSAELEEAQASAKGQLTIARESMTAAHSQLGERLRQLYIEGDVDPLAVLLGAESLDDALAAFDGLNRLAEQDQHIIEELTKARAALRTAITRLAARRAELRATLDQAEAAHASLARAQAQQNAYLDSLRRQQDLNRSQISKLSAQAAASEQRSEDISSSGGGGGGAPPPGPPPQSGSKVTVSSTGYCLRGTTATGIPVGWGVIAVDPSFIPLGTRMFVPGYGEGVAADTGSAVKGAVIDLWFPTCAQALQWGWRTVTITLH